MGQAGQEPQALPIWDIAVQTEGKARLRMAAYARLVKDPEMRSAIALNAWEENRHKQVLSKMVQAYGIPLGGEPSYPVPRDAEWEYLLTGYSECIDSFFAFGLFEMARRSGLFPPELVGDLRARHAGRMPPHPALCQLGGLAPCEFTLVATSTFRGQGVGRLDIPGLGANRYGSQHRCERQRDSSGQQLHR